MSAGATPASPESRATSVPRRQFGHNPNGWLTCRKENAQPASSSAPSGAASAPIGAPRIFSIRYWSVRRVRPSRRAARVTLPPAFSSACRIRARVERLEVDAVVGDLERQARRDRLGPHAHGGRQVLEPRSFRPRPGAARARSPTRARARCPASRRRTRASSALAGDACGPARARRTSRGSGRPAAGCPCAARAAAAARSGSRSAGRRGPRGSGPRAPSRSRSLVGGGHDAHVHLHALGAAHAQDLALLQRAQQLHLQVALQVAHLVEEQRRAARPARRARSCALSAPVKAPFSWPNSSASRMLSGSAATLTA